MTVKVTYKKYFAKKIHVKPAYGNKLKKEYSFLINRYGSRVKSHDKTHKTIENIELS